MITLAICDGDMMARSKTRLLCEEYFKNKSIECQIKQYSAGEEFLVEEYTDILLLDVRLKRMNGILVKEVLEKTEADTRILFISENRNYMAESFGKNVYGYLIKPIKENVFARKMDEIMSDIYAQSQYVFCKKDYEIHKIRFKDILYVEVSGRKTSVFVRDKELGVQQYCADMVLATWGELLPKEQFVKANKRQIVNLAYVVDTKCDIEMVNEITISKGIICEKDFQEKYDEYKSGRTYLYRTASEADRGAGKVY